MMVKALNYSTVSHVISAWDSAKRTPGFEEIVGLRIINK